MTLRRSLVRLLLVGSLTAAGLVASTPPATASFHEMMVVEVFAGAAANVERDFVELQMWSAGQNFVAGHKLSLYDAAGSRTDCTIPATVGSGADDAKILFATPAAQSAFITADFTIPPLLHADGGAVCFENIDCVSWGTFAGSTTSPAGMPEPGGIPLDSSIERQFTPPLDPTDDTNDSAADFQADSPDPNPNGGPNLGMTTCRPFAGGPGGGGGAFTLSNLKTRVKGGRAIISGKVMPPAPGEQVKLTFFANGSPLRKIASKSATLNASSEFKKRFKVPADSTRCKVVVRFQGAMLGQRKFRC